MTQRPTLTAHALTKRYGPTTVVSEVTLALNPGEINALVGGSGAGKSTLLRLLAGMERPDSGRVTLGDLELSGPSDHVPPEKRRIGLIFQDFALFPHLTVARNISFGLSHLPKTERETIAQLWIKRFDLTARADAYPHELSGGEQQRVAIARALAPQPAAILMDEPFSGLDPELRDQVRSLALDAIRAAGIPALLVTHDAGEALAHADQIAVMRAGHLLQTGTGEALYHRPVSMAVAQALGPVLAIPVADLPDAWQAHAAPRAALHLRPEAIQPDPNGDAAFPLLSTRRTGALTYYDVKIGQTVAAIPTLTPLIANSGETLRCTLRPDLILPF